MGGMSGTLMRPAGPPLGAVGAANARRLGAALVAVVTLHAVLLVVRPGALAGNYVAPSAPPVMAIRMLRAPSVQEVPAPVPPPAVGAAQTAPTIDPLPAEAAPRPPAVAQATTTPGVASGRVASVPDEPRPTPPVTVNSNTRAAEAPLAAAPDYALGVRLDPGPRPLEDIEPEYTDPVHLREGVVVLRLLISDTGHVDNVAVVRAEPRGVFEQAALEAFGKARFSPGLAAGTPVKSQITVEVQFVPINRGARVSGRTY